MMAWAESIPYIYNKLNSKQHSTKHHFARNSISVSVWLVLVLLGLSLCCWQTIYLLFFLWLWEGNTSENKPSNIHAIWISYFKMRLYHNVPINCIFLCAMQNHLSPPSLPQIASGRSVSMFAARSLSILFDRKADHLNENLLVRRQHPVSFLSC